MFGISYPISNPSLLNKSYRFWQFRNISLICFVCDTFCSFSELPKSARFMRIRLKSLLGPHRTGREGGWRKTSYWLSCGLKQIIQKNERIYIKLDSGLSQLMCVTRVPHQTIFDGCQLFSFISKYTISGQKTSSF